MVTIRKIVTRRDHNTDFWGAVHVLFLDFSAQIYSVYKNPSSYTFMRFPLFYICCIYIKSFKKCISSKGYKTIKLISNSAPN